MPLLHIEHPEDAILTGDLDVLSWMTTPGRLSVKIDGSPAIVWGTDPKDGQFFVGTKSVFNKKIPKLIKSIKDLEKHGYDGELFDILFHCFRYLPRTEAIYQGDFIGYGGESEYTPNTLTYHFKDVITANILVAPHTVHVGDWNHSIRDTAPVPLKQGQLESTLYCHFVQPRAYSWNGFDYWDDEDGLCRFNLLEKANFARQMATMVDFATPKEAAKLKKVINGYVKKQIDFEPEWFGIKERNLMRLWKLVYEMKLEMLADCRHDSKLMKTSFQDELTDSEGYVFDNGFGTYKLVDRNYFSLVNFIAHQN